MAAITAAVAVGAVAAAGTIASAAAERNAAKNAADEMDKAYDAVSGVDIDATKKMASDTDEERFKKQFEVQEKYDPTVAALRKEGANSLLAGLQNDPAENQLIQALQQEGLQDSPQRQALIEKLVSGAEQELNAGATLPPEFQAELVRSGLEQTGGAGLSADYRAATGAHTRTLLGSAGIALQQQRRDAASQMLTTADQLKQNRAAILANTLGAAQAGKTNQQARATNAYSVGASGVPGVGLTGADVANMNIANNDLRNSVLMGKGMNQANVEIAKGAATSKMIGAGTQFATSLIGGIGGMGGMGGAGGASALQGMGYQVPSNYGQLSYGQQAAYVNTAKRNQFINPNLYE